ncbi:glycosyl hydrolase family 71-domain-containing protein [Ilyonectria robusta]|uniref:glycosyl hydrolase family 71-domain-containing protein n=1 Tax=Ilyonectria robusta TaxID=1079257 RepID=UPI001E8D2F06|nr:glycosyl hydrolase family 71-domain-containing protein [Ilyonectria robusta]KAH8685139.1 glycosyl hydrolase family 71-domain-containing protein [Ilyonectria robusta]
MEEVPHRRRGGIGDGSPDPAQVWERDDCFNIMVECPRLLAKKQNGFRRFVGPSPTGDDKTFQSAAQSSGKLFMVGVSPLQFKHMDVTHNWYRRGEDNLQFRLGQVLELQPDMIELQTWNDAGESHYMGNIWSEATGGDAIPAYTDGYNHTGYWEILPSFIQA